MSRKNRIVGEPDLHDSASCIGEIILCNREIKRIEQEEADWISSNPGGKWPGVPHLISQWQKCKAKAETGLNEFNTTGL
jgi:hypothetical protein